ncbi:hypothetical protein [Streptomyces sp. NBC_01800]|uniref:hypothetical protein n=1 Tax=Streptomyces sp. NBC_01800 TaxID=2975945 RepID=UPI002DDBFBB6|nr:hypothetical protein [Streptomyces sp. NBC_01800]WSA69657.1 hypothetical protein OIE65_23345 [Streptomyces sp. NBC_01800]
MKSIEKEMEMSTTKKRILAFLAVFASFAGFALISAPAASAGGYGCSGSLIDSYSMKNGSTTWGTTYLYYDSSTGNNCAVAVKGSAGYAGTATQTTVYLQRCASSTPGNCGGIEKTSSDVGNYTSYAGPVSLNAAGHCIQVTASIWNPAHTVVASTVQTGVHCG